jgi:hypothetical protein
MGVTEIVASLLSIIGKVMDRMPTYNQTRKAKFLKLKEEYESELIKDFPTRDDELIILKRMELLEFARVFQSEIQ